MKMAIFPQVLKPLQLLVPKKNLFEVDAKLRIFLFVLSLLC